MKRYLFIIAVILSFTIAGVASGMIQNTASATTSPPVTTITNQWMMENGITMINTWQPAYTASPPQDFTEVILIGSQVLGAAITSSHATMDAVIANNTNLRNTNTVNSTTNKPTSSIMVSGAQQVDNTTTAEVKQNIILYTSGSAVSSVVCVNTNSPPADSKSSYIVDTNMPSTILDISTPSVPEVTDYLAGSIHFVNFDQMAVLTASDNNWMIMS